jgi:hypothetical protein
MVLPLMQTGKGILKNQLRTNKGDIKKRRDGSNEKEID